MVYRRNQRCILLLRITVNMLLKYQISYLIYKFNNNDQ